jgi:hypothetical protein
MGRQKPGQRDQKIGEVAAWIRSLSAQRHEGLGRGDLGEAFPAWRAAGRATILQSLMPQITPSGRLLLLAQERDTEPEAAD